MKLGLPEIGVVECQPWRCSDAYDARYVPSHYAASEHRVGELMGMGVSIYRESGPTDEPLRTKLVEIARGSHASGIVACMCCCSEVENR
jgi:hypothetical protein